MSGLSLVVDEEPVTGDHDRFVDALSSLGHFPRNDNTVVVDGDPCLLGATTDPAYPMGTHERDGLVCYLEGATYAGPATWDDLESVAERLLDPGSSNDPIGEWLAGVDGEFVLCAVDTEAGTVAVLNDLFGRLPVYYSLARGDLVLSREVRFLLAELEPAFDRLGLAQTLLFNYTLGDRTLWQDVRMLPPATAIVARDGDVTLDRLHEFDFGEKRHADRSLSENARAMADRFVAAVRARSERAGPDVVSLSGGHDSRAVASGFHAAELPCTAATFVKRTSDESADVEIAREVADALGVPWTLHTLPPVRGRELKRLLGLKAGLNHLGMSFILAFLEQLRERHGPEATYLTGDGGDKTVPDLSPSTDLDGPDELVEYVIEHNSVASLDRAASVAGVDPADVRAVVRRVLATYPESDPADRYVHFLIHERGFNWLFEAEDRNRHYLWSTTPFYAQEFFQYAMNVPDEQKSRNRLYREFLAELWPRAIELDDADFSTPMASRRYELVQYGLDTLGRHPRLKDAARTLYRGELRSSVHPNLAALLDRQLDDCTAVGEILDAATIREIADDRSARSRQEAFALLTVTSSVEDLICGTVTRSVQDDVVFEGS